MLQLIWKRGFVGLRGKGNASAGNESTDLDNAKNAIRLDNIESRDSKRAAAEILEV